MTPCLSNGSIRMHTMLKSEDVISLKKSRGLPSKERRRDDTLLKEFFTIPSCAWAQIKQNQLMIFSHRQHINGREEARKK